MGPSILISFSHSMPVSPVGNVPFFLTPPCCKSPVYHMTRCDTYHLVFCSVPYFYPFSCRSIWILVLLLANVCVLGMRYQHHCPSDYDIYTTSPSAPSCYRSCLPFPGRLIPASYTTTLLYQDTIARLYKFPVAILFALLCSLGHDSILFICAPLRL